jgi:hypothetical protein
MTANELIENAILATTAEYGFTDNWIENAVVILKQQAQEITDLKIANQDLKYQLIQKSGEQVLTQFKELTDEEILKIYDEVYVKNHNDGIDFARAILKKASQG